MSGKIHRINKLQEINERKQSSHPGQYTEIYFSDSKAIREYQHTRTLLFINTQLKTD